MFSQKRFFYVVIWALFCCSLHAQQLDTLSNRMLLIHTYKAVGFMDDDVALWIPNHAEIEAFDYAVNKKISYTKVFKKVHQEQQCTVYFMTFVVRSISRNIFSTQDLYLNDIAYWGKAVFELNNTQKWELKSFEKQLESLPELEQKIKVDCLDTLSANVVLNSLYNLTNMLDSSGIYTLNDYEVYTPSLLILDDNKVEVTFDEIHYYSEGSKEFALLLTSFGSYDCHICLRVTSLTKVEKQVDCRWKIIKHTRFWRGNSSWGELPSISIVELKMGGELKKVISNSLSYGNHGYESFYNNYYALSDFELLFSYESDYTNWGAVFNSHIGNLYEMHNDFKGVLFQDGGSDYDFKLLYYHRNIYQKSEYYAFENNTYQLIKQDDTLKNEERKILCGSNLFLEAIFEDSLYTLDYISLYGKIDLEVLNFLNETAPTKKSPSFYAPLYLREQFHLLFDKDAIFDLDALSKEYSIVKEEIECVNAYYGDNEKRKHFLLIPK